MKKFEYACIERYLDEQELNSFGQNGWELCTVREGIHLSDGGCLIYIFKREIVSDKEVDTIEEYKNRLVKSINKAISNKCNLRDTPMTARAVVDLIINYKG